MASDVIGLVGEDWWRIPAGAGNDKEGTEVAHSVRMVVGHDDETDDGDDSVEGNEGAAQAVAVTEPGLRVHVQACEDPRWHDEALRLSGVET